MFITAFSASIRMNTAKKALPNTHTLLVKFPFMMYAYLYITLYIYIHITVEWLIFQFKFNFPIFFSNAFKQK